ncbi:MAG: class I tRNA ligase family protein, partial [Clostridia bacterium]|nr:class I tRNA ligase family protein [Clostridia bacterium]
MEKNTFYITTPIYYPSNKLTLGNCYTTVVCDGLARFNRMCGKDVFYLTGTDEHGQRIQQKAAATAKAEMEYRDEIIADTKNLWNMLDISYDKFIRTTDDYHVATVQKIFKKLYEKGEIYKSAYKGLYCTPCESFWTEEQLVNGNCPDCGRPVQPMEEEAYFFRLSNYQDKILDLYNKNPNFLRPQSRVNEMVNNFIKPGLKDLCVSRTSVKWGVPVDFDPKHTVYVWIDALPNYISALG